MFHPADQPCCSPGWLWNRRGQWRRLLDCEELVGSKLGRGRLFQDQVALKGSIELISLFCRRGTDECGIESMAVQASVIP